MQPKLAFLLAVLLPAFAPFAGAQAPQNEITPFTAWLDFHRLTTPGVQAPGLPIWMSGVTSQLLATPDGTTRAVFRIQLRALGDFDQKRLLRLFFDDEPGASPVIVGRGPNGEQRFARGPFGEGLNLPSSETLVFSPDGVDAIEVQVPGNGHNIRGAFLTTLRAHTILSALDFLAPTELLDAFGRTAPLQLPDRDVALYGRVKATLDAGPVKFSAPDNMSVTWEFELQTPPLIALLDFETLNADDLAPLQVIVNDQPLGPITVHWPDLADPGFVGSTRPLVGGMHFRYSGWLRAQKTIPGNLLKPGANRVIFQLHPESGPSAVRSLELQLKHNWNNLDYTVTPSSP